MSSKLLIVGDLHLSSRSPASYLSDYPSDCLEALQNVLSYGFAYDIQGVVLTGDIFHTSDNSMEFLSKTIQLFRNASENGFSFYSVIGNHDTRGSDFDSWIHRQTGVLHLAHGFEVLGEPRLLNSIVNWTGPSLGSIAGLSAYCQLPSPSDDVLTEAQRRSTEVLVCHHWIEKSAWEDPLLVTVGEALAVYPNLKYIISGHDHSFHGTDSINGVRVIRPGSLNRISAAQENNRIPQFAVLDLATGMVDYHPVISARPFEEVFFTHDKALEREQKSSVDEFVSRFASRQETQMDVQSVISSVFQSTFSGSSDSDFKSWLSEDIQSAGFQIPTCEVA